MNHINIIFSECTSNYPEGFSANNAKFSLFAKGILCNKKDVSMTFLNSSIYSSSKYREDVNRNINGIDVVSFKNVNLFKRITVIYKTIKLLKEKRLRYNYFIFCEGSVSALIIEALFARLYGYKVGYVYHEWHVGFKMKIHHLINKAFMDFIHPRLSTFLLPISEFLIEKTKSLSKPYFKLLPLADYNNKITASYTPTSGNYILYCASIAYYEIALMLVNSLDNVLTSGLEIKMVMVLSGDQNRINKLADYISSKGLDNNVIIKQKLSDNDLYSSYKNSKALLIPLNPSSITEKARFSQKIAEYLSTSVPVISTKVGDIPLYFEDKKNIIFSDYNENGIAESIQFVLNNPNAAIEIGSQGRQIGEELFSHIKVSREALNFMLDLYEYPES